MATSKWWGATLAAHKAAPEVTAMMADGSKETAAPAAGTDAAGSKEPAPPVDQDGCTEPGATVPAADTWTLRCGVLALFCHT